MPPVLGGRKRCQYTALATLVALGLALSPATLLAQRRGFPDVGGVRVGVGFGHGGWGHHGFGHGGTHVGMGVGVRTGHVRVGVGLGFDSFHQVAVRPRFFPGAFVPFGFPVIHHHRHFSVFPGFVPVVPVFGGTTVVVVPGYGPFVNNGYYVDPPPQTVSAPPSQSRYVVESGSAGPVRQPARLILLAFQDHSIYAATDYWVEGDTLVYTTSYGARNQTPLSSLDLDLTTQLNRERGIEFSLDSRTVR